MALSKLERSNKAHVKLITLHENIFRKTKTSDPKSFKSDVNRDYHRACYYIQTQSGKLLTKSEKRDLYKNELNTVVTYRKRNNRQLNWNMFIPKKYR